VPPDIGGPRIRVGFLWFFLAMAAVTSGRWWTAVLAAVVAAAGGYQLAGAWSRHMAHGDDPAPPVDDPADLPDQVEPAAAGDRGGWTSFAAAAAAAVVPLAASWGTGATGAVLALVALAAGGATLLVGREVGGALAISALLPAISAASIVLALQVDLWAALFLVLTVSLYDAGNFALGAEASSRWEGPVGGVIGALAVTFTMATIKVPPLERPQWWIAGAVVAGTCAAGQWATSYFLPTPSTWVPAMRRLDAYLLAGPLLVVAMWLMGA
jgi:hypothetical protein